jgi:hypothetical protein
LCDLLAETWLPENRGSARWQQNGFVILEKAAVQGAEVVMPVRTTFYEAKEIGGKDPAGHMVNLVHMAAK